MNYLKITLSLFFIATLASCFKKPVNNISTGLALEKYRELLENHSFFIYAESFERPIKWFDSIPENVLIDSDPTFTASARPGEVFIYQLGVWALTNDINYLQVEFSPLYSKDKNHVISGDKMTCFNKGGINYLGEPFIKAVNISSGRIQALWLGIDLEGIGEGTYKGKVSVIAGNKKQSIPLSLQVSGEKTIDHGYNEGKRMTRLNWLNSTVGFDDEVTRGFKVLEAKGKKLNILGRTITISDNGLPSSIISYFNNSNSKLTNTGTPVTNNPLNFVIEKEDGKIVRLKPGKLKFNKLSSSKITWNVINSSKEYELKCSGELEYDGFIDYKLELTAKTNIKVKDIRLEISMNKNRAEYMMGLGHEGGKRTPVWKWKWDIKKHQDKLWIGAVNGGLRVKWKAENYVRPLVNIYYEYEPLKLPTSWGNEGKGGVNVEQKGNDVNIISYSGSREIKRGDVLNFDFELLITPFKLIDKKIKYGDRYFHGGGTKTLNKVENAKKSGANIVNIHHAEDIYPFINYPCLDDNIKALKKLVYKAHAENIRMKFYYTTRELTKNLPEFFAFFSLNGEIIFPGQGNNIRTSINKDGPDKWLVENLRERYIPAWPSFIKDGKFRGETDLSVITTPDSRLNNFYVAGLDWMVQNIGIDGIYIDDSALDRITIRRARKIIDKYRRTGRIDFHSCNHYRKEFGYANCLNLYMELLPYIDLVWIGEGRDYNRMPDHWLIEVSGIPFGISGQMLEGGGNPWRGMVYGITSRAGWIRNSPSEIWKFWDEYSITDKTMIGYWEKDAPLRCSNPMVRASIYKGNNESLIAIANWSTEDQCISIDIDFLKLGYKKNKSKVFIPEIPDFQKEQLQIDLARLVLPGGKGYILVIKSEI